MSHTDVLTTLDCGKMFVLSSSQLAKLLRMSCTEDGDRSGWGDALDVGTGDGDNIARWFDLFSSISCTEVNRKMCEKLRKNRKITQVWETDSLATIPTTFDVITICNVLDRCDTPASLLRDAYTHLRDSRSRVVVTVPLPLSPSVEAGWGVWRQPKESL
uniref:Methyltransferase-like protein 9 n=1 Tax=Lygus hesperus TaxID=30085 RepID=A0A146MB76_LYGHE